MFEYDTEMEHWVGKPRRLRAAAPVLDEATLRHVRLIGAFEIEADGEWTHYVFSPVVAEAERQRALVKAYEELERAKRPSPVEHAIVLADTAERNTDFARKRFLDALPREARLLDRRIPVHFDANGDIFILFESNAWHLTKAGEWCEAPNPNPVVVEPSAEERALIRVENELAINRGNVERLEELVRATTSRLEELTQPKRRRVRRRSKT